MFSVGSVTTPVPPVELSAQFRILSPEWSDDLAIVGSEAYTDLVFSLENMVSTCNLQ